MLESLIAISVIAFGALGVAGLNLMGLRSTQESAGRTAAAELSQEIGEKLRAHSFDYYATIKTTLKTRGSAAISTTGALQNCYASPCTEANQLTHELNAWAKSIDDAAISSASTRAKTARLPGGQGIVCLDNSPNDGTPGAPACSGGDDDDIVVKIWWTERQKIGEADTDEQQRRYSTVIVLGY